MTSELAVLDPRLQQVPAGGARPALYLVVEEVAERLRCSTRTIHELTRTNSLPHRRLPGTRRCLFRPEGHEAWENRTPLEVTPAPGGCLVVTPSLSRGWAAVSTTRRTSL